LTDVGSGKQAPQDVGWYLGDGSLNGVGQLREKHAHHVTPWTEGSRHAAKDLQIDMRRHFRDVSPRR
jgi:hypothetical protein